MEEEKVYIGLYPFKRNNDKFESIYYLSKKEAIFLINNNVPLKLVNNDCRYILLEDARTKHSEDFIKLYNM